jgi:hypothetical protein
MSGRLVLIKHAMQLAGTSTETLVEEIRLVVERFERG